MPIHLPLDLAKTLASTVDALRMTRDPWWVISGAAVALHGVAPTDTGDVDLLMSLFDARALVATLGIAPATDGGTTRFRSELFARWTGAPLDVEIMAGFHVATVDGWREIWPTTRMAIPVGGDVAYVPDRAELAGMLRVFGRPKDLVRATLLESL